VDPAEEIDRLLQDALRQQREAGECGQCHVSVRTMLNIHLLLLLLAVAYTQGEVTSQSLWSRYDHHFVGITRHDALS